MSEEIPVAEGEIPRPKKAKPKRGCFVMSLGVGIFLILFSILSGVSFYLEVAWYLLVGWILFLIANIKTLELNLEMALCGVGALLIATYGLHHLLTWVRGEKPWRRSWTLSITVLMLMLFGSSIAMTGMIHQLGWMAREPFTQSNHGSRADRAVNISRLKELYLLLIEYDFDQEQLPQNFEELGRIEYIDPTYMKEKEFQFYPGRGFPSEPWIYLGAGKSLSSEEGRMGDDQVLIISPRPIGERWVVLRADGAVILLRKQKLRANHPELFEKLPHLLGTE